MSFRVSTMQVENMWQKHTRFPLQSPVRNPFQQKAHQYTLKHDRKPPNFRVELVILLLRIWEGPVSNLTPRNWLSWVKYYVFGHHPSSCLFLDKDRTSKNICTNVPSSQTFRSYLEWSFSWFFSVRPVISRDGTSDQATTASLRIHSNSLFTNHATIRDGIIVWGTGNVVK
jgi:hypothetical protein